ncbi:MAG TPA: DMT family transporter [Planctomycetota bacterium]|nr:DMT family transporter [Planctomycetota bacterium]
MSAPRASGALMPHLWLLLMIAIWGGSYSVVKVGLGYLAPFTLVAARFWLAVLCLLPFVLRRGKAPLRQSLGPGLVTGAALATGYMLQTVGMNETTASMGGFLSGLIVLLVALGGWLLFREPLQLRAVLGLLLGLSGLVLLCLGKGDDDPARAGNTLRGILLQVASSTSYAGHILLISRVSPKGAETEYCLWQLLVVAVVALVAMPITGAVLAENARAPDGILWFVILYLGVLATAVGIAVQSRVQPRIQPTHVALLFATQPLFAAVVGSACLGDQFGWSQLVGGAAIVAGVIAVSLAR